MRMRMITRVVKTARRTRRPMSNNQSGTFYSRKIRDILFFLVVQNAMDDSCMHHLVSLAYTSLHVIVKAVCYYTYKLPLLPVLYVECLRTIYVLRTQYENKAEK